MNYRQLYAIKKANKERILKVCPNCPETSGIYFLLREEDGFKYAYIGQSVNILQRLADHLQGYQYIDLSIKKHGLWSEENQTGWVIHFLVFPKDQLDEQEQYYIKKYANKYTIEEINKVMKNSSNETLGYTEDEIVSSDVIGIRYGSLFDATQTKIVDTEDGQLVKVVAWYDNEMSYTCQMIRTAKYLMQR